MKLKHIGDVLLATPCIRTLHEAFPSANISMLVNEGTDAMLQGHPLLKEILCFPRSSMRGKGAKRIRRELSFVHALRRRRFDMTVDLTSADRAAWLSWLSGARYRLALDPEGKGFFGKRRFYTHLAPHPKDPDLHEVKKNLGILEYFGISSPSPKLELHLKDYEIQEIQTALHAMDLSRKGTIPSPRFAVIHPTSRWLFKCWNDERFAELIDWLQQSRNCPVIVTCGPDPREKERAWRALSHCSTQPKSMLGALSLRGWAALVREASLFIGVDSAPMHIAASQGVPTIALFGPTGFQNWRPWAVPHSVLAHDCPCSRDRRSHCDWERTRACMDAIHLSEVREAVDRLLPFPPPSS